MSRFESSRPVGQVPGAVAGLVAGGLYQWSAPSIPALSACISGSTTPLRRKRHWLDRPGLAAMLASSIPSTQLLHAILPLDGAQPLKILERPTSPLDVGHKGKVVGKWPDVVPRAVCQWCRATSDQARPVESQTHSPSHQSVLIIQSLQKDKPIRRFFLLVPQLGCPASTGAREGIPPQQQRRETPHQIP